MAGEDIKTLVSWHQYCLTIASSVFNQATNPHSTRYCNFLLHPSLRSNTVNFSKFYTLNLTLLFV